MRTVAIVSAALAFADGLPIPTHNNVTTVKSTSGSQVVNFLQWNPHYKTTMKAGDAVATDLYKMLDGGLGFDGPVDFASGESSASNNFSNFIYRSASLSCDVELISLFRTPFSQSSSLKTNRASLGRLTMTNTRLLL